MNAASLNTDRLYTDLDIPVDPSGSIRPSPSGDVASLSGRDNLTRAIMRRLVTQPGSLVHRPTYGCGVLGYIGLANSPATRSKLANAIRANLLQDRRLKDVTVSLAVGTADDASATGTITVTLSLTLRDGTSSPLTLELSR
jgi:phage baseplate assembly protein W